MEHPEPAADTAATPEPVIDPAVLERLRARLTMEQNLPLGIAGAVVAALLGAAVWAVVTVSTQYQIGWMAVGVGFVVGVVVRRLGRGITPVFGVVGAMGALAGCVLGNLFSVCGFVAKEESLPFMQVTWNVLTQPRLAFTLLQATFTPMDLLFYGIAIYEGYKFAFRVVTPQDLERAGTEV